MSGTFLISKLVDTTAAQNHSGWKGPLNGRIERVGMNATIHFNKMVM